MNNKHYTLFILYSEFVAKTHKQANKGGQQMGNALNMSPKPQTLTLIIKFWLTKEKQDCSLPKDGGLTSLFQ